MFFRLLHSGNSKYKYAYKDLSISGIKKVDCEVCGRSIPELCYSQNKHVLAIEGGKEYPDYLEFCDAGPRLCILSQRAVDVFVANKISGISEFVPISFDNPNPSENPFGYYIASIEGRIDFDLLLMQLKKKQFCNKCGQFEWNRKKFPPVILSKGSWDNSDICRIASLQGYIVCTEKVIRVVKENKLTGFAFQELKLS